MRQHQQAGADALERAAGFGEALRLRRRLGRLGYLVAILTGPDAKQQPRRVGIPRPEQLAGRRTGA